MEGEELNIVPVETGETTLEEIKEATSGSYEEVTVVEVPVAEIEEEQTSLGELKLSSLQLPDVLEYIEGGTYALQVAVKVKTVVIEDGLTNVLLDVTDVQVG